MRPSIVAEAVRALVAGREPEHRVLTQPGWWQRPSCLAFEPYDLDAAFEAQTRELCGNAAE